ncbi:MAG: cation-translocating P-type ATPase [Prevotella sp.]|nr:cation-translocating P-type ATPase [Prevotella sp.]
MKLFESLKMTILSGIALFISLIFLLFDIKVKFDPAWITIIISGLPLLYLAIVRLIFQRWISSALLICIAMIACIYIGQLFAAGEVAFIMAIGELLEDYTVKRAKRGISNLISIAPDKGRIIKKNGDVELEEVVDIEKVQKGDILRVIPGERIPVDGEIIGGSTSVDQSIMTGESLPIDKTLGEKVFCGTLNCYGSIDIKAEKVGEDSSLQKMINLVKEAEEKKAPTQRIVDKWATWLVPIALLIAIIAYIFIGDLVRSVTVLVVFCPCALALATPVSIVAGIGQATKFGILIKSGEALEQMGKVTAITLDKTGTLTLGTLSLTNVKSFSSSIDEEKVLLLSASCEARSEHPIGKAIIKHLESKNLSLLKVDDFKMYPGSGVSATIDNKRILCGKSKFLEENGIKLDDRVNNELEELRNEGKALVLVASGNECIGVLALSDKLRPKAKEVINELNLMGVETVMLTGDNAKAAKVFAQELGIKSVRSELLPEDKVNQITSLQKEGKKVCMIGDGVNDAPALKIADVGVAMGSMGSDIAIDSADIALMGDDITQIPYIKRLSNAVIKSIKLNITLSMIINFIAITLSLLGLLGPVSGALVHNAGSVLVVLNAALLYDRKI